MDEQGDPLAVSWKQANAPLFGKKSSGDLAPGQLRRIHRTASLYSNDEKEYYLLIVSENRTSDGKPSGYWTCLDPELGLTSYTEMGLLIHSEHVSDIAA